MKIIALGYRVQSDIAVRFRIWAISHQEAIEKVEKEFNMYREREMKELQSDFNLLMKSLQDNNKKGW